MKHIKHNIKILLSIVIVMFLSLSAYLFYAVYSYGGRWFATPYNVRLSSAKATVTPGDILDRHENILATTDAQGNRTYPCSSSVRKAVSHVLGDTQGMIPTGAESFYAADLLGFNASVFDRFSQLFTGKYKGSDVQLTIDAQLHDYISDVFPDSKEGAVAILNYQTGEVLALYSKPEFDVKRPENYEDQEKYKDIYINRASQGRYAPGSVFKIVTMACALEHIPHVQERTFDCAGTFDVTNEDKLVDTDGEGHGHITMEQAFTKSCNIAFGQLALELGYEKLRTTAQRMGFNGNFLFSDLIAYESLFPKDGMEQGELAWTGVGQGRLTAVPLHFAMIAGAVANEGMMVEPQLLLSVRNPSGGVNSKLSTKSYMQIMGKDVAKTLQDLMLKTVQSGTGTRAAVDGYTVAGKTGTAQVNSSGGKYQPHAWFVGYVQEESAPFAIAVIVENGGSGSSVAGKLAGKILDKAIDLNK